MEDEIIKAQIISGADDRIQRILDIIDQLRLDESVTNRPLSGYDGLEQVDFELRQLAKEFSAWQITQAKKELRLNEILEMIIAIAMLDFEHRAHVGDEGDVFDAVASGLNGLSEELYASTVSKTYLDNTLNAMINPVIVVSTVATIRSVNEAALILLGYTEAELLNQPFGMLFSVEAYTGLAFNTLLETEGGKNIELTCQHKNGQQISILLTASLLHDVQGNIQEIICMVQDISEHKQAEKKIKAALAEKEVLLKEIHHRVKNNMQVISSLLDLQSTYLEDEAAQEMMQESRRRVRSMALVHEQLYQSADLARIDFADYVHDLVGYLGRVYGNMVREVMIEVDISRVALTVETAVPLGLIINEMVSNAYKHAFPDGRSGQIHISLQEINDDQFCLFVQDDGRGFPADVDFRHSPSLGLTIIMTLVDQLQGQIELILQNGTRFELTFPAGERGNNKAHKVSQNLYAPSR